MLYVDCVDVVAEVFCGPQKACLKESVWPTLDDPRLQRLRVHRQNAGAIVPFLCVCFVEAKTAARAC